MKKFLSSKKGRVALIGLIILIALIILTSTGVVHAEIICSLCHGTGYVDGVICDLCGGAGIGVGSIWAFFPPVVAIVLALVTKEVYLSLFIGILSGAILLADFNPLIIFDRTVNDGLINSVSGTAGIFIFLVVLGIIVVLVNKAGGSAAFGKYAQRKVKTKVGATIVTFLLGVLIFIDDYFNCLTVGSVMRPVTDRQKISRAKLAYIIDSTAAPICMIAPISSWAAAVSQYAPEGEGFTLFIKAIPMNFYCILTIVFIIVMNLMKIEFGPMKKHEEAALNGDLFLGERIENSEVVAANEKGRVIDLIIPILVLIVCCVFALLYNGGLLEGLNIMEAFANTDATVALPLGALVALIIIIVYLALRGVLSISEEIKAIPKGFVAMVPSIIILTLATSLKTITGELGAAYFVGNTMNGVASTLMSFLPAVIFAVACALAFSTGTSWGTFGILIPIVVSIFTIDSNSPLMILSISACLAGAVCGDHCSPISDTTIMSSTGAECQHINHVSTQMPYAIYVAVVSFVCFLIAGFIPTWYIMLPLSIVIMIVSLFVTKYILKRKEVVTQK